MTNVEGIDADLFENVALRDDSITALLERLQRTPPSLGEPLQAFRPHADSYQAEVVNATAQTIRLVAPAGSGKTQTLVNRMMRCLRDGIAPARLLLLTF